MRRPRPIVVGLSLFFIFAVALPSPFASAGSVTPMTVRTLSDLSGQVIVGRVTSVRSYWADHPKRIESEVRFETVEYLKGRLAHSTETFTLVVPGGKVGEMQMQIADAPRFAIGEKWMLFLLPTYKTFPVAGLHQGAFKITIDGAGIERVYLPEGEPVNGIDADGWLKTANVTAPNASARLLNADHVQIRDAYPEDRTAQPAVRLDEFRREIAPILRASRDHHLIEPAGKRVFVEYTPVPFRAAGGAVVPATPSRSQLKLREGLAKEAPNVPPRKAGLVQPEARP